MHVRQQALHILALSDPESKAAQTLALYQQWCTDPQPFFFATPIYQPLPGSTLPGCPERPVLMGHTQMAKRSPATLQGRAVLMHSIAHIELNAINLALDAVWRFDGMPDDYYTDWLRIASEEATHFRLLRQHLQSLQYDYGDFPAHQGLWAMCDKTAHDITARMALVPRTLEARGLDATPQIQRKLRQIGTPDAIAATAILDIILRDEVGHVATGNHWYRWLCQQQGHDPHPYYLQLTALYDAPRLRPPFNIEARVAAGFTPAEMDWLKIQ